MELQIWSCKKQQCVSAEGKARAMSGAKVQGWRGGLGIETDPKGCSFGFRVDGQVGRKVR